MNAPDMDVLDLSGRVAVVTGAASGQGRRIIMWSSIAAARGQSGDIPYTGSKAALEGMARPLAAELAHHEITVNVIDPGAIDTRCWA